MYKKNLFFSIMLFLSFLFLYSTSILSQSPQYFNLNNGTNSNSYPFNMPAGRALNIIIRPGEFAQPAPIPAGMMITKLYFRTATTITSTYSNLRILMTQDTIINLTSGQFYYGTMDTVYFNTSTTLSATTGGWMGITLNTPFNYDPSKSLIIFAGHCQISSGTYGFDIYNTVLSGTRRVWSVGGCPFVAFQSGDPNMANVGIDAVPMVGIQTTGTPADYYLEQNYPNPFNPASIISYSIPKSTNVRLTVNDVLGREVAILVDGYQIAGKHSVEFNASNLASGVYYYKINADNFTDVKKMVLIK